MHSFLITPSLKFRISSKNLISSFSDLISFLTLSSCCSTCCCSVCNCCTLASSSPSVVSNHGSIGRLSYGVLPSHVCHVASHISPSLLRNCRGRQRVSHVSARHRRIDARCWLFAVRAFAFRLFYLGFPAFSCYYQSDCGMNVRCVSMCRTAEVVLLGNDRKAILLF